MGATHLCGVQQSRTALELISAQHDADGVASELLLSELGIDDGTPAGDAVHGLTMLALTALEFAAQLAGLEPDELLRQLSGQIELAGQPPARHLRLVVSNPS